MLQQMLKPKTIVNDNMSEEVVELKSRIGSITWWGEIEITHLLSKVRYYKTLARELKRQRDDLRTQLSELQSKRDTGHPRAKESH